MKSNSKLNKEQKQELRKLRVSQPLTHITNHGKITIAYQVVGENVKFSTAIMSKDEKKFRRKVGEFYARERFYAHEYALLPYFMFFEMMYIE